MTKVLDLETLESEVIFERHVEAAGPTERDWPDAFAPDKDAAEFVVPATYDTGHENPTEHTMSDSFRFAPGRYSTPDTATFTVRVVADTPAPDFTRPRVIVEP